MATNDPLDARSRRKPEADVDGLSAFATEDVVVTDTADDTGLLIEVPALPLPQMLPAVRTPIAQSVPVPQDVPPTALERFTRSLQALDVQIRDRAVWPTLSWMLGAGVVVALVGMYAVRPMWQKAPAATAVPDAAATTRGVAVASPPPPVRSPTPSAAEPAVRTDRPLVAPPVSAAPPRTAVSTPEPRLPIAREVNPGLVTPPATAATRPAPSPAAPVKPVASPEVDVRVNRAPDVTAAATEAVAPAPAPREAAPLAASAEPPVAVSPLITDRSAIDRLLHTYQEAYDRLDAPSTAAIWPRVDTRALSRAFSTLAQQDMSFDRCDVTLFGVRATAHCTGAIRYVRRVGDQIPRVRNLSWSFDLERVSDRWQIASVTAE